MRALSQQEKRTVSLAGIGIAIYLILFFGVSGFTQLRARRAAFDALAAEAAGLKAKIVPYQSKVQIAARLMESFRMDPMRLSCTSVVTEASVAIQKAATTGGIQLGPIRETPNRASGKELSTIQLEASGPLAAVLNFIAQFESLGFPLVVDTMQVGSDPQKPGMIKLNLTILILDFDKWKTPEAPHA